MRVQIDQSITATWDHGSTVVQYWGPNGERKGAETIFGDPNFYKAFQTAVHRRWTLNPHLQSPDAA